MKGYITTREKCFVCGKTLEHDERRNGCFCPDDIPEECLSVLTNTARERVCKWVENSWEEWEYDENH